MVLSAYCKQGILQLYFERRISYERVVQVLAAEGFGYPSRLCVQLYISTRRMEQFLACQRVVGYSS